MTTICQRSSNPILQGAHTLELLGISAEPCVDRCASSTSYEASLYVQAARVQVMNTVSVCASPACSLPLES